MSSKKPPPQVRCKHAGKSVVVFDDILSDELVKSLFIFMSQANYELRPSFDNEWSVAFSNETFRSFPELPEIVDGLIDDHYQDMSRETAKQHLSHMYCAAIEKGTSTMPHVDIPCPDCLSFLYYGNITWNAGWGGETLFYDDDGDTIAAVAPKKGRLIMFNAGLLHRAGVPQNNAPVVRYTMSIFYRCKKFLQEAAKVTED